MGDKIVHSQGKYNRVYVPKHPNSDKRGYVLEHRIIMEESIGRLLTKNEIVHHINGDSKDNRIENLEIMTLAEHTKYHTKPAKIVSLVCPSCGKPFVRVLRYVKHKQKKGQKNFYCSKKCIPVPHEKKKNKDRVHGVRGTYSRGCRCKECTRAQRIYQKEYRKRKRDIAQLG